MLSICKTMLLIVGNQILIIVKFTSTEHCGKLTVLESKNIKAYWDSNFLDYLTDVICLWTHYLLISFEGHGKKFMTGCLASKHFQFCLNNGAFHSNKLIFLKICIACRVYMNHYPGIINSYNFSSSVLSCLLLLVLYYSVFHLLQQASLQEITYLWTHLKWDLIGSNPGPLV